ncbi:hypothetical protein ACTJIJ_02305 [Niabella sp. 22666]|uniref:hypothetical protein n=1 Tax=Niabella sp. 22666 TaxID=3453954 RepID=UPI003F83D5BE
MKQLLIYSLLALVFFTACSKDEIQPNQLQFIHIMDNESSAVSVSEKANSVSTYNIYFSTPQNFEAVTVTYKITVGNGLVEGVDYQLINTGNSLTFLPGIYDMPVRIRWIANPIDTTKNNTLTIELVSNDKNIPMGLPGPDGKQKSLIITKIQ